MAKVKMEALLCGLLSVAFIQHFASKTLLLFQFYADAQSPKCSQSPTTWLHCRQLSLEYYFSS